MGKVLGDLGGNQIFLEWGTCEAFTEEVTSEVGLKAKRFCLKEKNIEECNAVQ